MRAVFTPLVTLALASAMHLDWHLARPEHHRLSLGWSWHWLLAIPAFALTAWYAQRHWPGRGARAALGIIAVASILAAVIEPAWEFWIGGASWDWAFGPLRLTMFAQFLGVGLASFFLFLLSSFFF